MYADWRQIYLTRLRTTEVEKPLRKQAQTGGEGERLVTRDFPFAGQKVAW